MDDESYFIFVVCVVSIKLYFIKYYVTSFFTIVVYLRLILSKINYGTFKNGLVSK